MSSRTWYRSKGPVHCPCGPDGWKGSTINSTATCLTWRGMGSVRLYLAHDSPYVENKQPYHTKSSVVPQQPSPLRDDDDDDCHWEIKLYCIVSHAWNFKKYILLGRFAPRISTGDAGL